MAQLKSSRSFTFTLLAVLRSVMPHLLGDAGELVVEDFEQNRIGRRRVSLAWLVEPTGEFAAIALAALRQTAIRPG